MVVVCVVCRPTESSCLIFTWLNVVVPTAICSPTFVNPTATTDVDDDDADDKDDVEDEDDVDEADEANLCLTLNKPAAG